MRYLTLIFCFIVSFSFGQIDNKIDSLMKIADSCYLYGNLSCSIDNYSKANLLNPANQLALDGLKRSNEEERERLLLQIRDYAEKEFLEKNWIEAKKYYQKYLRFKPDDSLSKNKIIQCDNEIEQNRWSNYEYQIKYGIAERHLKNAENEYKKSNLTIALDEYNFVKTNFPDFSPNRVESQILVITNLMNTEKYREDQKTKLRMSAEKEFENKNWNVALYSYEKILLSKPTDSTFIMEKIATIKKNIKEFNIENEGLNKCDCQALKFHPADMGQDDEIYSESTKKLYKKRKLIWCGVLENENYFTGYKITYKSKGEIDVIVKFLRGENVGTCAIFNE